MNKRGFLAALLILFPILGAASTTLHAFGDSITFGYSATNMNGYAQQIAIAKGWTLDNRAHSGDQVPDSAALIYNYAPDTTSVSTWMPGFNDFRYYGNSPQGLEQYKAAVLSLAAWLAIPESSKTRAANAASTGTWANTAVYGALGRYSATLGSTLTFNTVGTVVYVAGIMMQNAVGGQFSVTIDGNPAGVGKCFGAAPTYSNIGYSPFLLRYDGLRPGAHVVVVTVISSGTVFVDWAAGNSGRGPVLYIAGPLRMSSCCYQSAQIVDFDHGTEAIRSLYEQATRDVAKTLTQDGLDVVFVDANLKYVPDAGDNTPPDVHPNDQGHAHIASAFLDAMP